MTAPDEDARLFDADRQALERLRVEVVGHAGDDEVEPRREQLARQRVGRVDANVDLDARRRGAHALHRRRGDFHRRSSDGAEGDGAAPTRSEIGELALGLCEMQQHRARMARERMAERRQADAARHAVAQRRVEQRFQFGDSTRRGGLRYADGLGRGADHAGVGERRHQPQMRQFHAAARLVVDGDRPPPPDSRAADARFIVHCPLIPER